MNTTLPATGADRDSGTHSAPWPPTAADILPEDGTAGALAGRVWDPAVGGPSVVAITDRGVVDVSASFPTMRALFEAEDPAAALRIAVTTAESRSGQRTDGSTLPVLCTVEDLVANTVPETRDESKPWLLSPIDLQVVKAAGVTFPISMLERIIEEKARGDLDAAAGIRAEFLATLGDGDFSTLRPGSDEAAALKELLIEQGWWSQYLEVGIGPDAEVFTKAPVLATVGTAVEVGIHSDSHWNNPEPEVVLAVSSRGTIVGATLGNDVNLRDIEGRSALLLPKAKDNNASAAVGPFIRFFDEEYTLDDVRTSVVTLAIDGEGSPEDGPVIGDASSSDEAIAVSEPHESATRWGYHLDGSSPLEAISRDPADLVAQVIGDHHQYPDGFVLYLGTLFAPVEDRGEAGRGFTHQPGDVVRIAEPRLGALVNRVQYSQSITPWTYGIDALYSNLAARGLLAGSGQ